MNDYAIELLEQIRDLLTRGGRSVAGGLLSSPSLPLPLPVRVVADVSQNLVDEVSIANQPLSVVTQEPEVKFASISCTGINQTTIVNAVPNKRIRVLSVVLVVSSQGTVRWRSGLAGSWLSGEMPFAERGGYSLAHPYGLFQTGVGEALVLSHSVDVGGHISYVEV